MTLKELSDQLNKMLADGTNPEMECLFKEVRGEGYCYSVDSIDLGLVDLSGDIVNTEDDDIPDDVVMCIIFESWA